MSFADEAADAVEQIHAYHGEACTYWSGPTSTPDVQATWHQITDDVDDQIAAAGDRYVQTAIVTISQSALAEIASGAELQRSDATRWRFIRATAAPDGDWHCTMGLPADQVQPAGRRTFR